MRCEDCEEVGVVATAGLRLIRLPNGERELCPECVESNYERDTDGMYRFVGGVEP